MADHPDPAGIRPEPRPVLLLTRPRAQSLRFAAEAAAALPPHDCVIAPLIEIVHLPLEVAPEGFATLVFTSENGVASLAAQSPLRDRPVWCVGPRTAAAAEAAGFRARSAAAGGGDAEALIAAIRAARPALPLLHLRGEHAVTDLAGRLTAAGLACDEAVVYAQRALPAPPEALEALRGPAPVLLPLFSPRSAALAAGMVAAAGARRAPLRPVAISAAAAARWSGAGGAGRPVVADSPDGRGMITALAGAWERLSA